MNINIETKYSIGDEVYYLEHTYEEREIHEIHTCWKCKGLGKLININKEPYICPFCNGGEEAINDYECEDFWIIQKDVIKTIMLENCPDSKSYSISYRTENGEYFVEDEIVTSEEDMLGLQYDKNIKSGWTEEEIKKINQSHEI